MTRETDRELLVRIDERVGTTHDRMERLESWMDNHEERDREDFKEDRVRLSKLERKQNWMLGVGSTLGSVILVAAGIAVAWAKNLLQS